MSFLMPTQLIASAFEALANKAIALHVDGNKVLTPVVGKTLVVDIKEIAQPVLINVSEDQLLLISTPNEQQIGGVDCTLISSIETLIELKQEQQLTKLIKEDKIDLVGDIKVAQQFAHIAQSLDIDWQSELASIIGDVATFKLLQANKLFGGKLGFAKRQITEDATQWLIHEKKLAATGAQISLFSQTVKEVESDMYVLEQRIESLSKRMSVAK